MKEKVLKEIMLPESVTADVAGAVVSVKGPLGTLQRDFSYPKIRLAKQDSKVMVSCDNATKREKKMIGTTVAHINNMVAGVQNIFEYKLQVCSVHFPMSVAVSPDKKEVIIKNFLGETNARKAPILKDVEVKIQQDIITVSSNNKESAAQTAANIETATRIKARDRRIFQDGIFITEKAGEKI